MARLDQRAGQDQPFSGFLWGCFDTQSSQGPMEGLMTILGRRSALLKSTRSHTSRKLREDVALRHADRGEGANEEG
jgi:acyl-CoA synthetase (AMP-forming)/AMP-acid ligase II